MLIDRSLPPSIKSVEVHKQYSTTTLQNNKRLRESDSPLAPTPSSTHQESMLAEILQTVGKTQSDLRDPHTKIQGDRDCG